MSIPASALSGDTSRLARGRCCLTSSATREHTRVRLPCVKTFRAGGQLTSRTTKAKCACSPLTNLRMFVSLSRDAGSNVMNTLRRSVAPSKDGILVPHRYGHSVNFTHTIGPLSEFSNPLS